MLNAKKLPNEYDYVKKASPCVNAFLYILLAFLCGPSCASQSNKAPILSAPQPASSTISHHVVAKGDTLYAIAWRYNLDYKHLSQINKITPPYAIKPGQVLQLAGVAPRVPYRVSQRKVRQVKAKSPAVAPAPAPAPKVTQSLVSAQPKPSPKVRPPTVINRSKKSTKKPVVVKTSTVKSKSLVWGWPVKGKIVSSFSAGKGLNKGIDIAAKLGESVRAAADGQVVYAGSGLRGYGNLIIVKHQNSYLSAYAHNSLLLAKEGDDVTRGEKIAEVGGSGATAIKLHFEIRRDGVPVDPLKYLPR